LGIAKACPKAAQRTRDSGAEIAKEGAHPLPVVERLAKRLSIDLDRHSRKSVVFTRVEPALFDGARELAAT
jgi:hypothetical protein